MRLRPRQLPTRHRHPHLERCEDEVEAYLRHRLTRVDWQGNPDFDLEAIAAIHRHSGGIPRKVNQLAHRLMLHAAVEGAELLTAQAVEAVAAEMGADAAAAEPAREEKVLPLRSARLNAVPSQPAPSPDPELARRMAALEARTEEHEAMLRRVLVLLVDWVEAGQDVSYRTHAA